MYIPAYELNITINNLPPAYSSIYLIVLKSHFSVYFILQQISKLTTKMLTQ